MQPTRRDTAFTHTLYYTRSTHFCSILTDIYGDLHGNAREGALLEKSVKSRLWRVMEGYEKENLHTFRLPWE